MKRIAAILVMLTMVQHALAGDDSQLVARLKAGKSQTVVAYGTSLTEGGFPCDGPHFHWVFSTPLPLMNLGTVAAL